MNKKYIVRLNDEERKELIEVITKLKGTSQKVKRAQILLKADADGPDWPHCQIADQTQPALSLRSSYFSKWPLSRLSRSSRCFMYSSVPSM